MNAVRRNDGEQLPQWLFAIENGMVRVCVRERVRELAATGGRGSAGADPSADADADPSADAAEHFLLRKNRIETEEIIKKISADDDVTKNGTTNYNGNLDTTKVALRPPRSGTLTTSKCHFDTAKVALLFFIS